MDGSQVSIVDKDTDVPVEVNVGIRPSRSVVDMPMTELVKNKKEVEFQSVELASEQVLD